MRLEEFNLLDINDQADYIWNYQPLDERRDETHSILLYSLPDFYAEVWYHWGDNRIVTIKAFRTIQALAPYIILSNNN
ncbi:MAG: hypothetical protein AAGC65_01560 [Mucilaginibacter sp.]|uniref:hypothetical protein n=1 Tax=Mucilaginibacter sp. TaxID=1882438 RepID=UPI0031B44093